MANSLIDIKAQLQQKRLPTYRKIVRFLWIGTIASLIGMIGLMIYINNSGLPSFRELEDPKNNFATEVIGSNNDVIGRFYIENRVAVNYDQLSPHLVNALIATEDERFYRHSGIDGKALGRVFVKTVLLGQKNSGGGSTITQQLAKLLYTKQVAHNLSERALQKLKEWVTAVKLERSYTKQEILTMYLNQFNFINGAYGIKAASEIYFDKGQDSLGIAEAATLIGMLKNPSLYNPLKRPELVRNRRNVVFQQMFSNKMLTIEERDSLMETPLEVTFTKGDHLDGIATYFRASLSKEVGKLLEDNNVKKSNGDNYNIYRDGLKIYTTIDPLIQEHAETAVQNHMAILQKEYHEVWKNMDPWTYIDKEDLEDDEKDKEYMLRVRRESIEQQIKTSGRYEKIFQKVVIPEVVEIEKDFPDLGLRDYEVDRLIEEARNPGYLDKLRKEELISKDRLKELTQVLKSPKWPSLRAAIVAVEKESEKQFKTKTPMKVFAYGVPGNEVDTIMTPLDSIRYHNMILQAALVAMEPGSGFVKAYVGGVDFDFFKYDHVHSNRQVGSTFKPFVYATAIMQQGLSPCHRVRDVAQTIRPGEGSFHLDKDWTPANAKDVYTGRVLTLKEGLRTSTNTVSVFLMKQLGSAVPVVDLVANLGIDRKKVPAVPSLALGSCNISPIEMVGAYGAFANAGTFVKPIMITRIEDNDGKRLYQYLPEERQILNTSANYVMVEMLKYNVQGARDFWKIKSEVGGKTGTTNSYRDGWFMGITPSLVIGTWVGGDYEWIRMRTLGLGAGSHMARPIFVELMSSLEKDDEVALNTDLRFKVPDYVSIELDCSKYDDPTGPQSNDQFLDDIQDEATDELAPAKEFIDDPFAD